MDWKECKDNRYVKEVREDKSLIDSLIKSSEKKIKSAERLELDETTASTKVSICYEALREILEALAIKKGFKIYNHECFCAFLNEICNDKTSSLEFNAFRLIRNNISYYGEDISIGDARILIKKIISLRDKMKKRLR